ncbi:hypothetical protein PRVXH_002056 [Proteinivorax hydrogeniformans]|uniref:Uncharacterized protein n=1 Tax=Proteinivorax hydrogeniformans TaxID=1826727 RepID=A0AAU8HRP0_9FIRM
MEKTSFKTSNLSDAKTKIMRLIAVCIRSQMENEREVSLFCDNLFSYEIYLDDCSLNAFIIKRNHGDNSELLPQLTCCRYLLTVGPTEVTKFAYNSGQMVECKLLYGHKLKYQNYYLTDQEYEHFCKEYLFGALVLYKEILNTKLKLKGEVRKWR